MAAAWSSAVSSEARENSATLFCEISISGLNSGQVTNLLGPSDAYNMHHQPMLTLVQLMACHLLGAKLLAEPNRILLIGSLGTNFSKIVIEIYMFLFKKMHLIMLSGR